MARACSRLWEAEAVEDGRLDGLGLASFQRHVAGCGQCTSEVSALRRLRELSVLGDVPSLTPLEHRRRRLALLRAANLRSVDVAPERRPRRAFFAVAVGVLVLMAVWMGLRGGPSADTEATAVYEATGIGRAEWQDQSQGALGRVALSQGTLSVHVAHLLPGQRFLVSLPDGEIEVRGTRFIVETERGHTQRVLVTEGIVDLRLNGHPARHLGAGASWARSEPRKEPEAARGIDTPTPPASVFGGTGREPRGAAPAGSDPTPPNTRAGGRKMTAEKHVVAGVAAEVGARSNAGGDGPGKRDAEESLPKDTEAPASPAARSFVAAMNAFSSGAYADADWRLAEFLSRFPGDSRCEDALFLRTVCAVRQGQTATARSLGRDYLSRFPGGLRRDEVARLVGQDALAERAQADD